MDRKPEEEELLPLDTKLERTLRNLRKVKSAESTTMANQKERMQPIPEEAEVERLQRQMTIGIFRGQLFKMNTSL